MTDDHVSLENYQKMYFQCKSSSCLKTRAWLTWCDVLFTFATWNNLFECTRKKNWVINNYLTFSWQTMLNLPSLPTYLCLWTQDKKCLPSNLDQHSAYCHRWKTIGSTYSFSWLMRHYPRKSSEDYIGNNNSERDLD